VATDSVWTTLLMLLLLLLSGLLLMGLVGETFACLFVARFAFPGLP
jgi:hypothetical protein